MYKLITAFIVATVFVIAVTSLFYFGWPSGVQEGDVQLPDGAPQVDIPTSPSLAKNTNKCDFSRIFVTTNQNEYRENDEIFATVSNMGGREVFYWTTSGWPTYPAGEKYDEKNDTWMPTTDRYLLEIPSTEGNIDVGQEITMKVDRRRLVIVQDGERITSQAGTFRLNFVFFYKEKEGVRSYCKTQSNSLIVR